MKNSQKGFASLILIIILAIAVVGGGYYYSKNHKTNPPVNNETGRVTTTSETTATTSISENKINVAGWKTYTSEEFGFEIQYPKDWYITNYSKNGTTLAGIQFTQFPLPDGKDYVGDEVFVNVFAKKEYMTSIHGTNIIFNGISAIDTGWIPSGIDGPPSSTPMARTIRIGNNSNIEISLSTVSDNQQNKEKLEEILSTFKFKK